MLRKKNNGWKNNMAYKLKVFMKAMMLRSPLFFTVIPKLAESMTTKFKVFFILRFRIKSITIISTKTSTISIGWSFIKIWSKDFKTIRSRLNQEINWHFDSKGWINKKTYTLTKV